MMDIDPETGLPSQYTTFVAVYFRCDDKVCHSYKFSLSPSLDMLRQAKEAVRKKWPDDATCAHLIEGRDRVVAEYRK